ncbi:MerR family transcriptional regulator [Vreelandella nanhaiensis]|uniref:MerR family transcriptional regulator n=1 Tax=Vreelandella nanhaiensis TaxID=1258546 RepID=A0A433KLC1_9GAMM|nr:MerR family transcriptional regulator [Halomonas nanhaiensis]RUR30629.1 MerR family transcriptional regulator [Halomonas nanhaiensis]
MKQSRSDDITKPMQAGELARRAGITVRTLHHYDALGLLKPSGRTEAGYRLYNVRDITRLQRIQLLKNLGFTLADIASLLQDDTRHSIKRLVDDNITALDIQIDNATRLRDQLQQLRNTLAGEAEPSTEVFLNTLELLEAYSRYFSRDELQDLRFYTRQRATRAQWQLLLDELNTIQAEGVKPCTPTAQDLAVRWMEQLEQDTAGNPELLRKLSLMAEREQALQDYLGVEKEQVNFIQQAFLEHKLAIFRRHLSPSVYTYLAKRYGDYMKRWPPLLRRINQMLEQGISPESKTGREVAQEWLAIFQGYAGQDPKAHAEIRKVQMNEPELRRGTWLQDGQLAFLQRAMATLKH